MLFPFGQEPLESEKSSCSSLGLVSFIIYKCLLSVLCWSWDKESAWKTDPSWASENQACLPSNLRAPALARGPHWTLVVSRRWWCCSRVPNHTQRSCVGDLICSSRGPCELSHCSQSRGSGWFPHHLQLQLWPDSVPAMTLCILAWLCSEPPSPLVNLFLFSSS